MWECTLFLHKMSARQIFPWKCIEILRRIFIDPRHDMKRHGDLEGVYLLILRGKTIPIIFTNYKGY